MSRQQMDTIEILGLCLMVAVIAGWLGIAIGAYGQNHYFQKEAVRVGHAEYYDKNGFLEWRWKEAGK